MKRVLSLLLLLALLLAGCQKEQITTVCDYCGAVVSLSAKFCGECGQNLSMPTEQTTVPNTMGTTTASLETEPNATDSTTEPTVTDPTFTEPTTTETLATEPPVLETHPTDAPTEGPQFNAIRFAEVEGVWYAEGTDNVTLVFSYSPNENDGLVNIRSFNFNMSTARIEWGVEEGCGHGYYNGYFSSVEIEITSGMLLYTRDNYTTRFFREENYPNPSTDIIDVFNEYNSLVNKYAGIWYLAGYADVYIYLSRYEYLDTSVMRIESENFSLPLSGAGDVPVVPPYTIYPHLYVNPEEGGVWAASIEVAYKNWEEDLRSNSVSLFGDSVVISGNRFVREKGAKTEPPITEPPVTEPPVTEPPITEPPVTEPPADVLIISDTRTLSNQTIDTDVYITSTGVVTFTNVTVNGNIYCYGKLTVSGGSAHNLYAYYWDLGGITSSCKAWDGTHGLVKGAFKTCESVIIKDDALDYAFDKWGKR